MARTARTIRTSQRARETFLLELAQRGNISDACRVSGVGRTTVYELREADESFRAAWDEAIDISMDAAEHEAYRRGVEGVDEPVFGRLPGKDAGEGEIGTIRKYSDTLLLRVLSAHRPAKWRERSQVEHTGEITQKVYAGFDPDNV